MICPNCKSVIDDDSRFCKICGVEFLDEIKPQPEPVAEPVNTVPPPVIPATPPSPQKNSKSKIIILTAVLIVVIALGSLMFVLFQTDVIGTGKETVTDAEGEELKEGRGKTEMTILDVDGTKRTIITDRKLLTSDKILAEYTTVMNKLKTDAPAFTYQRYQNLPTEHQNTGAVADFVLPIIEKYVTSKNASEKTEYIAGNAQELPLPGSSYGCILTDASAVKNAYCEILDDGNYKLVMTLKDELNPPVLSPGATTSSSITNSVFDTYDALNQITSISELAFNKIDFNYTDCTVTLIYNPNNSKVESINMRMNIDITANTLLGDIKARIVDNIEYTEIKY